MKYFVSFSLYSLEMNETFLKHRKWEPEVGLTHSWLLSAELVNVQQPGLPGAGHPESPGPGLHCACVESRQALLLSNLHLLTMSPKLQSVRAGFFVFSEVSSLLRVRNMYSSEWCT